MSDVEKICWINAARRKWADEIAEADRAWRKAESERSRREQIAIRRCFLLRTVQRLTWALLGAAVVSAIVCAADGLLEATLTWLAVGAAAGLAALISEGEE